MGEQFRAALQVLADLATPSGTGPLPPLAVPLEWFRWVPPCEELFEPSAVAPATTVEAVLELLGSRGPIPSITIERGFDTVCESGGEIT